VGLQRIWSHHRGITKQRTKYYYYAFDSVLRLRHWPWRPAATGQLGLVALFLHALDVGATGRAQRGLPSMSVVARRVRGATLARLVWSPADGHSAAKYVASCRGTVCLIAGDPSVRRSAVTSQHGSAGRFGRAQCA
jgi:hypothetical protein